MSTADPSVVPARAFEAVLTFDEALLRRAAWYYWFRIRSKPSLIAAGVMVLWLAWIVWRGDDFWELAIVGAVAVLNLVVLVGVYLSLSQRLVRAFRKYGRQPVTFLADEAGVTFRSPLSSSTLAWSLASELRRYPDLWLLLFSRSFFFTLPTACLSPELQAFLVERMTAAGKPVR